MADQLNRAMTLISDMLHMMDQRPDGPQSAWYKAAWALMQEKPNRGLVYQIRCDGGEWEEITEAVYQLALSRADVTGAELRILHTAPPAQLDPVTSDPRAMLIAAIIKAGDINREARISPEITFALREAIAIAKGENGNLTPAQVPDGWKITYLAPSKEMIEEGAQRLVSWSDNCRWPDSWSAMQVAGARNDAEHVWRSMWLAAAPQPKGSI